MAGACWSTFSHYVRNEGEEEEEEVVSRLSKWHLDAMVISQW
jgi:hypothetical protein